MKITIKDHYPFFSIENKNGWCHSFVQKKEVEVYLFKQIGDETIAYFKHEGGKFKIHAQGLHFKYSRDQKVKFRIRKKMYDAKVLSTLYPNSNGIRGLSYLVYVPILNEDFITSEQCISIPKTK